MRKFKVDEGCVLCLMCVYECPKHAISIIEDVSTVIDPEKCIGCGKCAANCQREIIHPYEYTKEQA